MTMGIAHRDNGQIILDAIRVRKPPFSPEAVVSEFCDLLREYRIKSVTGDRWGGDFVREKFQQHRISYTVADKDKSELYAELLPLINSAKVELLDNKQLIKELAGLERRSRSGGKDRIDHAPGQHDDAVNSAAGALVYAGKFQAMCKAPRCG
jgi:hypothetical protein